MGVFNAGQEDDASIDQMEDILNKVAPTLFIKDEDEKKKAREALATGPIPFFLKRVAAPHGGTAATVPSRATCTGWASSASIWPNWAPCSPRSPIWPG